MKHTPTPYEVYHESSETYVTLPAGKLKARAVCRVFHLDPEQRNVDAKFIATACNSHDALVATVNALLSALEKSSPAEASDWAVQDAAEANARKLLKAIAK